MEELIIKSPSFQNNALIPSRYTCQGNDINPALTIENIPSGTQSLVLIVDDPDAPKGTWDHWIVWNTPATEKIYEDSKPGVEGVNSWNRHGYGGPCPPSGTHRYFFKIYALDTKLNLPQNAGKVEVEQAMESHILTHGQLVGRYQKN